MSLEEECLMLKEIEKSAIKGGVVEISKAHQLFEEKVRGKVAKYTTYNLQTTP